MHKSKKAVGVVVCVVTSLIAACGGGGGDGGGGNGGPSAPPPSNPGPFTIGGAVSGLAANATGLVVTNGIEQRAINANGTFAFTTALPTGSSYDIRVIAQPYDPYQSCVVTNGSGVVANAAVTATITCTTLVSKFASSLDFNSASYSQYAIDASTGQLRPRGYVSVGRNPVDVGAFGFEAKISFVLSRGDATLHAFRRDPVTGRVTEGASSPQTVDAVPALGAAATTGASTLTVHPRLPFVYVANGGDKTTVSGYRFDPDTAALTAIPGSPFAGGQRPIKLAIDSTGRFAYLVNRDSANVTSYTINQTTGALEANGSAVPTGGDTSTFPTIHPSGKFLYVPNGGTTTSSIAAFTIGASGALTAVAGSPFPMPANVTAPIHFHPSGKYLFVKANPSGNTEGSVTSLAIDQTTGALSTIGTPVTVGIYPMAVSADPSGRYLFVANRGPSPWTASTPGSISVLRIDGATGGLTALPGIAANAPYSVNLDWSGKYLYSASAEGNVVRGYTFDVATGALAPMADTPELFVRGAPVTLLTIPSATAEPAKFQSKFAYVPDGLGSRILAYSINTSGVLTPTTGAGPIAALAGVQSVTVTPSSRRLIALGPSQARTFPIDAASGALGASSTTVAAGPNPFSVVADPSGRFAYAGDATQAQILSYSIDASTGALTVLPSTATGSPPIAVAVHPNGRFFYLVNGISLGMRPIDDSSGALGSGFTTSSVNSIALAIHPSGNFIYVARAGVPGSIDTYGMYTSGVSAGAPVQIGVPANSRGNNPTAMAIHPTGRFLYVTNATSNNVAAFAVSGVDGSLAAIGSPTVLPSQPVSVRVDYSGKYVYVVDIVSQVRTFTINTTTGALVATAPTGPAASPYPMAVSEDVE